MKAHYWNEIDPYAAQWLRNLISAGHLPPGEVDTRSIVDVRPDDLAGYTQCHFFAGIGGWSLAARLAGWPDDRPLWTGSCPCQPFSVAGKGAGTDDPRHLWPHFFRLIRECRPPVVFGEQVSAAAGKRTAVDAHMHGVWRGEDLAGFLPHAGVARQFDWLTCQMQSVLPQMAGELQEWLEGADVGFFPEIPGEEPRANAGLGRALPRQAGGPSVRLGRVAPAASGADRPRSLRDDGHPVSSGWREDVGQPVIRPDYPGAWLHDFERAGGPVWAERHDEYLGRGDGPSGGGRAETGEGKGGQPPVGGVGTETEGASVTDWLDGIAADLDDIGYSLGTVDIPACAVDAPHIRSRLYWVAVADSDGVRRADERLAGLRRAELHDADGRGERGDMADAHLSREGDGRLQRSGQQRGAGGDPQARDGVGMAHPDSGMGRGRPDEPQRRPEGRDADRRAGAVGRMGHADDAGSQGHARHGDDRAGWPGEAGPVAAAGGGDLADTEGKRQQRGQRTGNGENQEGRADGDLNRQFTTGTHGDSCSRVDGTFWSDHVWLAGADGKARRAQPGLSLLAHGVPARVGRLRAYGNAIVPNLAAEVIAAFMDCRP